MSIPDRELVLPHLVHRAAGEAHAFPRSPSRRPTYPEDVFAPLNPHLLDLAGPTAIRTWATPSSTTRYASSTTKALSRSSSTTAPSCCSRPVARGWGGFIRVLPGRPRRPGPTGSGAKERRRDQVVGGRPIACGRQTARTVSEEKSHALQTARQKRPSRLGTVPGDDDLRRGLGVGFLPGGEPQSLRYLPRSRRQLHRHRQCLHQWHQ